jgi:hypothetical protein
VEGADAAVASSVVGMLGEATPEHAAFADLPQFTEDRVDALAELVGRWTATRRAA